MRIAMDERLTKYVGRRVEVCYKENGFQGIWYKAIIEATPPTKPKSKCRDFSVRLLKDNFSTPLTKLSDNVLIRPVPPVHVHAARIEIKEGCVVDASHKDGWWIGLVIKVIEDGKCLVLFDSPPDIIQFERKDLRPHLHWVKEKYWVVKGHKLELLKRLTEDPMFSSGTMVEVSCKINKVEVVWVPAMIIKEFEEIDENDEETEKDGKENEENDEETEEDDEENDEEIEEEIEEDDEEIEEIEDVEKKYIVKFCDKSLSCKSNEAKPNKTVGLRSIRPTPPSFWVEEYQLVEYVEAFHGTRWRQGQVMGFLSQKWYTVLLKATNEELAFKHSDLRPLKVWEDGVWKTKELSLTQALGNKMGGSVTNGNTPSLTKEPGPPVTPSPGIAATQGNTFPKKTLPPIRKQNGSGNDSTRENESSEDNNRKRKREQNLSYVANAEETRAKKTAMVLPFEKKLPIWETVESMEVFKTVPQTPHFSPLVETHEDSREMSAVGMMFTYSALLEEVKGLQLFDPVSTLECLNDSFAKLEKHGFDVKAPQSRIQKLSSLKDMRAKLKGAEKGIAEKESEKVENKRKILELQRLNEEADKEIAQMKSSAETIEQELEDAELQFQTSSTVIS